jgi:hypothetical protein
MYGVYGQAPPSYTWNCTGGFGAYSHYIFMNNYLVIDESVVDIDDMHPITATSIHHLDIIFTSCSTRLLLLSCYSLWMYVVLLPMMSFLCIQ